VGLVADSAISVHFAAWPRASVKPPRIIFTTQFHAISSQSQIQKLPVARELVVRDAVSAFTRGSIKAKGHKGDDHEISDAYDH